MQILDVQQSLYVRTQPVPQVTGHATEASTPVLSSTALPHVLYERSAHEYDLGWYEDDVHTNAASSSHCVAPHDIAIQYDAIHATRQRE